MEQIKKIIEQIFQAMNFEDVGIEIKKDSSLKGRGELVKIDVKINPEQAKYFLEENAIALNAFQHLLRILISKENPEQTFFILDINDYRKEREKFLIELAIETAQKVRKTKKPIALESMLAYERRLIHLKLAEQPDIVTESIGQEPERKIVVRLYP